MSTRTTRGTQKTLAVGVIRDFFRESPLPATNEFIKEFVMRHSYTYEYPDTPQGQRLWQQYHGNKINKEARQAILAKFGGKLRAEESADVAQEQEKEEQEEDEQVTETVAKEFVTQGEFADTDSDGSDGHFSLPLPVDPGVLGTNRDFQLPWNIYCPTGNVKPKSWKSIKRNIFIDVEPPKPSTLKSICACVDHCDESCLNKMLQFECDSTNCPFGDEDCGNREFGLLKNRTSRFYHQAIEIIHTENKGYGLRACRSFAPGELVCEYTGDVISPTEIKRRLDNEYADSDNYYFLNLEKGAVIDSGLRGSAARFVNHSCMPNCEMQKWFVKGLPRVGLFAGDDGVQNGQELTYDYNFVWFEGAKAQACHCGTPQCRGIIGRRAGEKATTERASSVGAVGTGSKKRASTADVVTPKRGRPRKSGSDSPKLRKPVLLAPKAREEPRDQRVTPRSRDSLKRDLLKRDLLAIPKKRHSLPAKLGKSKLRESLSAAEAAVATVPRKRGRPRKVVAPPEPEKEPEAEPEADRENESSVVEGFLARWEGDEEPKKNQEKTSKVDSTPQASKTSKVSTPQTSKTVVSQPETPQTDTPVKRKRGRPRKIRPEEGVESPVVVNAKDKKKEDTPVRRARKPRGVTLHVADLLASQVDDVQEPAQEDQTVVPDHHDHDSDMDTFEDAHEEFQEAPRVREKYTATPDTESAGHSSSDQDYAPTGPKKPVKKRAKRARRATANYDSTLRDFSDEETAPSTSRSNPLAQHDVVDVDEDSPVFSRQKKRKTIHEIEYVEESSSSSPPSASRRKSRRRVTLNKDYRLPDYMRDSDEEAANGLKPEDSGEVPVTSIEVRAPSNQPEEPPKAVSDAPAGSFQSFAVKRPEPTATKSKGVDARSIKGIRQLHQLSKEGGQFSTGRFRVDRPATEPPARPQPVSQPSNPVPVAHLGTPVLQGNPTPPGHPSPPPPGPYSSYYDPRSGYYPPPPHYSPPQPPQPQQPPPQPQYHTPGSVEDLLFPASLYPENLPERQKNGKTIPRSKRKVPVRYSDVKKDEAKNSASPPAPVAYPLQGGAAGYASGQTSYQASPLVSYQSQYPPTPQPKYYPPPQQPQYSYGVGQYYYEPNYGQPNYGQPNYGYSQPPQAHGPPQLPPQGPQAPPQQAPPQQAPVQQAPLQQAPLQQGPPPAPSGPHGPPGGNPAPAPLPPVSTAVNPAVAPPNLAPVTTPGAMSSPPVGSVSSTPTPAAAVPPANSSPTNPAMSPATSPTSARLPPISSLVDTTSTAKSPSVGTLPPPRLSIGKPGDGRRLSSTNLPLPTRQRGRFYGPL